MKKAVLIFLLFVIAGCSGSLKNSWSNFTAYYNTFYNAKNDYEAGLEKIESQPVLIDGNALVRTHPAPPNAGSTDFEEAIQKSAQLLRRHPDTKWTDDALLLIGKSYYYRQEYYLSLQKFEELLALNSTDALKQQAVIWKGRTLLDIESFSEGTQFLESRLQNLAGGWSQQNRSEAQLILGQHFANLEQWSQAGDLILTAVPNLKSTTLKGRSYFLLGQIFQQQQDLNRAFQSYSNVESNFPGFEYVYRADIKRAEVARLLGNIETAQTIYSSMLRDDKNFERRSEIYFQLAQISESEGNYREAERLYQNILDDDAVNNSAGLLRDTYYQLGQLYSNKYQNYELATAYFDSSSRQSANQTPGTSQDGAQVLAEAYGRYVSLKDEIDRVDSLLRLGSLSEEALQAELAEIRQQRRQVIQGSRNSVQQASNTLTNLRDDDTYRRNEANEESYSFGFLNYRNPEQRRTARLQFETIWGARPLADNWRRREAVATIQNEQENAAENDSPASGNDVASIVEEQAGIDIGEIPRTKQAVQQQKSVRLNAQYRLGSLFFLTLNQPDSAVYYYQKVLAGKVSTDLRAQTLYSLHEVYKLQQRPDSAAKYKEQIFTNYPDTRYARRIQNQADSKRGPSNYAARDSSLLLRDKAAQILSDNITEEPRAERAEKLRLLALNNKTQAPAPAIYYQAMREYIQLAKKKDSVFTASSNPGSRPSYAGRYWNQVRELIKEFKEVFPAAPQTIRVNAWANVLGRAVEESAIKCSELGVSPQIIPDRATFLASVTLPQKVQQMNLSGSVEYRMLIDKEGKVVSYELLSTPTNLGIEEAYQQAIEKSLLFEPILRDGKPVQATCDVALPIKR